MGLKQQPKSKENTCRFCQNGKYCKDETCINIDCPVYRNYCPCQDDYVELCKFAEKEKLKNDEL